MFNIKKWDWEPAENSVIFHYDCHEFGSFKETLYFPDSIDISAFHDDETLHRLIDLAAAYIGVSYYKLSACGRIILEGNFSDFAKSSIEKIYSEGLGEFYVRNKLPYPPYLEFSYKSSAPEKGVVDQKTVEKKPSKATIAFGGGKDSHVSMALLDELNIDQDIVSVVLADSVRHTLQKLGHKDLIFIKRTIDPKLIFLVKKEKGYNGHIPITAINSIILTLYSYMAGNDWVIFSNERGASVPTLVHDGNPVNHQYSKSYEFESVFRKALRNIFKEKIQYFSLLRPFSELWIARFLAKKAPASHDYFSSCNRNFIFEGKNKLPAGTRWCGQCSKCVYTALILAPHMNKEGFINIFETDILNDPDNIPVAKDLCGIGIAKPWECVGDFMDTAACLFDLSDNPEWKEDKLPNILRNDLEEKYGIDGLKDRLEDQINTRTDHFLPEVFQKIL